MRQHLAHGRGGRGEPGHPLCHRRVDVQFAAFGTAAEQHGRQRLRQAADDIRCVGAGRDVALDVLHAKAALPRHLAVLDDDGREPRDAGLLSERIEVAFEQRVEKSLPGPGSGQGKGETGGDGDHAEAVSHGPDAGIIALPLGEHP
jgi:hypothetical protein